VFEILFPLQGVRWLNVKPEVHNVAVLHNVGFAFNTQFAIFFYRSFNTVKFYKVFVFNNFGADKAFFKIGMDNTCCLWRGKALW
jgi:hypothetical protein